MTDESRQISMHVLLALCALFAVALLGAYFGGRLAAFTVSADVLDALTRRPLSLHKPSSGVIGGGKGST